MTESEGSSRQGDSSRATTSEKGSGVRLLLICHGEGMQHRYSNLGSVNSGLTAAGWGQVESLAVWLSTHVTVDALYSGPLLQSRLTAQRIGQSINLEVTTLREMAAPQSPESGDEGATPVMNGTGNHGVYVSPALRALLQQTGKGVVALVTSAESIRAILRSILWANDTGLEVDHTSISAVQVNGDIWSILYINRREHMPTPVVETAPVKEAIVEAPEEVQDIASVVGIYNRVATVDSGDKVADDRKRVGHLLKFAKLPAGLDILDAGTGLGVVARMLAEEGAESVIGVDVSPGMLEQAEYLRLSHLTETSNRVSFRLARLQSLPFPDERFGVVVSRLVLNHFKSANRVIQELVRVLKPNGIFLMAELLSVDDPVKRATQNAIEARRNPSHVAARSAEQYNKLITMAGMQIVDTVTVSFDREMREWLAAYRVSEAEATTVMDMVEAGLETDAAGIGAKLRGDRIEFVQRMYYLKAIKPVTEQ